MPLLARWSDNADIVSTGGQYIGDVRIGEEMYLVGRSPWRDMVALRCHDKHRHVQIGKSNRFSFDLMPAFGEIVVEKEPTQIPGVHLIRHARSVGIPETSGRRSGSLADQIVPDDAATRGRSLARNIWKAPAICAVPRITTARHIMSSRNATWLSSMNSVNSPASVEIRLGCEQGSRIAGSSGPVAPQIVAAAIDSSVPPRQYPVGM